MVRKDELFLHEEVALLSLRNRKGTFASSERLPYALGGAMLAELLLGGRVRVEKARWNRTLIELASDAPVGDALLDEALAKIATAGRRASPKSWVQRFARLKRLRQRVAEQLCARGILRADRETVLLIFKRDVFPEIDPRPERALIERLRRAIARDGSSVEPRTAVTVAIAHHAGLLKGALDRELLKRRKQRIKTIATGDASVKATREAIEAMQAAVLVACIVPAAAAASSH
ncbi:MAG: GPP34 family phosphoprotein [Candidatus Eiseniibacteriota bacterium]|jgi:hypothetical protein